MSAHSEFVPSVPQTLEQPAFVELPLAQEESSRLAVVGRNVLNGIVRSRAMRGALALGLAVSAGATVGTVAELANPRPRPAAANDGGYPDANMICVAPGDPQAGQTQGTGEWCDDYQWGYYTRNSQGQITGNVQNSSRGYGYRNCTDWVAWRVQNAGVGSVPYGSWHDGGNWDNAATAAGKTVDNTPEPGDIAVWDPATPGGYGHVAFVESVNADGTVNVSEYNKGQNGVYGTRSNQTAHHFIDLNGTGKGINGEDLTNGGGGNGGASPTRIDELAFIRTNHWSGRTEAVTWDGAPDYTTLKAASQTGYPAISDPENVTPLAMDTNGDGIDELAFIRTNHWSGRTEAVIWDGAPHFTTLKAAPQTGYPAITDPENVTPLAIDINGDNVDELAFIRTNHPSGRTEISLWYGAPNYNLHHSTNLTGYPAVADPANVTPLALDVNGDGQDELAFVRTNHGSGHTEISVWHGAPHYTTHLATTPSGYPAISDPENVTPIAIDINGDKVDELGFARTNHASGRTELSLWYGTPGFGLHHNTTLTGYPVVTDPANVTPVPIDLG